MVCCMGRHGPLGEALKDQLHLAGILGHVTNGKDAIQTGLHGGRIHGKGAALRFQPP